MIHEGSQRGGADRHGCFRAPAALISNSVTARFKDLLADRYRYYRLLSRLFRRLSLKALRKAFESGKLHFFSAGIDIDIYHGVMWCHEIRKCFEIKAAAGIRAQVP
jgi:hypothetical protein